MNVTIKVLNGKECTVSVEPEESISNLKQKVEKILKVPVEYQQLLLLGRTLIDENKINSYTNIKDGTKLVLVIKKPDPLRDVILKCFRRFFNDEESEKLTNEFMLDFEKTLKKLSLDDIERIAISQNA